MTMEDIISSWEKHVYVYLYIAYYSITNAENKLGEETMIGQLLT